MHHAEARPDDEEDAGKADDDGDPAPDPHMLAQDGHGQAGHQQRRHEADGGGVGERDVFDRHEEEDGRAQQERGPQYLQAGPRRAEGRAQGLAAEEERQHGQVKEVAAPGDLQHRQRLCQVLGSGIQDREAEADAEHEEDAAQVVGRGRRARSGRWSRRSWDGTMENRCRHHGGTAAAGHSLFSASAGYPRRSARHCPTRISDSCGKLAAALDNAIEKYYLRFHDRGDAG